MKGEGLRAEVGYGSKPRYRGGPVGVVANVLNREFAPRRAEQGSGHRHHVHPNLRRLAVSGSSHGSVLASDRRLGHALNDDQRSGIAGFARRSMETQTETRRDGASGSGQPVHQR